MENNLTTEEKIDYIFKTLQKQERREIYSRIGKWVFRLFIISYIAYFYFYGFNQLIDIINNKIKDSIKNNTENSEFIQELKDKFNFSNN